MKNQQTIKRGAVGTAPVGPRLQKSHFLSIGVLVLTLMAIGVWGAQRFLVPPTPIPIYAVGLGHTGTNADDWVVSAFYYPTADIPGDYDLFNEPVWAPPVGVDTPYVQGFFTVGNKGPWPVQQVMHNAPGARVPIWFVPVANFLNGTNGIPGGTWTVNSMKAEGAIVGWADFYSESWQPASPGSNHTIVASGVMEDGRHF